MCLYCTTAIYDHEHPLQSRLLLWKSITCPSESFLCYGGATGILYSLPLAVPRNNLAFRALAVALGPALSTLVALVVLRWNSARSRCLYMMVSFGARVYLQVR
jgi:hypothetical protein